MKSSAKISAKSVHRILNSDRGALGVLRERQARQTRAAARLGALLPAPLDRHCRIAALDGGALVLHVDAPAWLTRLRLEQPRLLAALRAQAEFAELREIRLAIAPGAAITPRPPPALPARVLPSAAAAQLRATASSLSDPALREALLRLARRAEPAR